MLRYIVEPILDENIKQRVAKASTILGKPCNENKNRSKGLIRKTIPRDIITKCLQKHYKDKSQDPYPPLRSIKYPRK